MIRGLDLNAGSSWNILFFSGVFLVAAGLICPVWSEEKILAGDLVWEIHLVSAKEADRKDLVIPEGIERACGALEKLAEKSRFRQFVIHKTADLPCEATRPNEFAWDDNLKFSFSVKKEKEKTYLEAAWLRRADIQSKEFKQIGGKVKKLFQPDKSLVLLGPKVPDGTAMAVLHLKPVETLKQQTH